MRLLHAARGRGAFPGGFGRELLPRSLSSGGLTGRLLGTSHGERSGSPKDSVQVSERQQQGEGTVTARLLGVPLPQAETPQQFDGKLTEKHKKAAQ